SLRAVSNVTVMRGLDRRIAPRVPLPRRLRKPASRRPPMGSASKTPSTTPQSMRSSQGMVLMASAVPMPAEQAQVPQVLTAMTGKGRLLPVIDVTNPAFAVEDSPAAIDALRQAYLEDERRRGNLPRFVVRLLMLVAAFRSPFLRAMMKPRTTFLDGL